MQRVRRDDTVQVISGKDAGKTGRVLAVWPAEERVLVEGLNIATKHMRTQRTRTGAQEGGIVREEAPIHLSNVAYVGKDGKPTRVGFKIQADGKKVRIAKSSGAEIDG